MAASKDGPRRWYLRGTTDDGATPVFTGVTFEAQFAMEAAAVLFKYVADKQLAGRPLGDVETGLDSFEMTEHGADGESAGYARLAFLNQAFLNAEELLDGAAPLGIPVQATIRADSPHL